MEIDMEETDMLQQMFVTNTTNFTNINHTESDLTELCKNCSNEFCISPHEYEDYWSFVSVDAFETVLIILNIIVFLTGIMGNLLVSPYIILIYFFLGTYVS